MNKQLLLVLGALLGGRVAAQADLALAHDPHNGGTEYAAYDEPFLLDSDLSVLELVSFEAASRGTDGVEVVFATVSERREELFTIQRSNDLLHWYDVVTLHGQGGTDTYTRYEIVDHAPLPGVSYYRLIGSTDGEDEELSDLFSVRHDTGPDLMIHDSAQPGRFTVQAQGHISSVSVLNNRGQFMEMELRLDADRVHVNAELLEPGTYYVQVVVDGQPMLRPFRIGG
jgi:hypothetical protein